MGAMSTEKKRLISTQSLSVNRHGKKRSAKDIAYDNGISVASVYRIKRLYKQTGDVVPEHRARGRPRSLTYTEVDVCFVSDLLTLLR
jgi:transposase